MQAVFHEATFVTAKKASLELHSCNAASVEFTGSQVT
jgi:hypothetical protein